MAAKLPVRWIVAAVLGLYLYAGLEPTGVMFYELYHLTTFDPVYWGYTLFKGAGYYFGTWQYQLHACVGVFMLVALTPPLIKRLRNR